MKNKKGIKMGGQNGSSKTKAQGKAQIMPEEKILCNHVLPVPTFFKKNTEKKNLTTRTHVHTYYILNCTFLLSSRTKLKNFS